MTTTEKLKQLKARTSVKTIVKSKDLTGFESKKDGTDEEVFSGAVSSYSQGETISLGNFAFRRFTVKLECYTSEDVQEELKQKVQSIAQILGQEIRNLPVNFNLDNLKTDLKQLVLYLEAGATIPKEKYESRKFDVAKSIAIADGQNLPEKYLQLDKELEELVKEGLKEAME